MSTLLKRGSVFLCLLAFAVLVPAHAASLTVSSNALSFFAVQGSSPAPRTLAVSTDAGGAVSATVTASTASGGDWLAVSTAAGNSTSGGSLTVTVSVHSSALPLGNYKGQVKVDAGAGLGGSPALVDVDLNVITAAPYIVVNPASLTIASQPGIDPARQALSVSNGTSGTFHPQATATTADGGSWLAVSMQAGNSTSTSFTAFVTVHSAGLAAGTYKGTVTITSAGAQNSPVNVPVTVEVGNARKPTISVAPDSFSFPAGLGANPRSQSLTVNNGGGGTLNPSISATTASGGNWLVLSAPVGGSMGEGESINVAPDITGLAKGTYSGKITVSDPNSSNGSVVVPVTLNLGDPAPVFHSSDNWLVFPAPAAQAATLDYSLFVTNAGLGELDWTAAAATSKGGNWLSLPKTSGVFPYLYLFPLTISTAGLNPGLYDGEIDFTITNAAPGAPNLYKVKVTLALGVDIPQVLEGGVVNGASFATHTVAPGSIISIFGHQMGPDTGANSSFVGDKLSDNVAGVQVFINGVSSPLYYVSEHQINVQVPADVDITNQARVQVVYNNTPSVSAEVNVAPTDPGIFSDVAGPLVYFNNTATQVDASHPAKAGDNLVVYAAGLGAVANPQGQPLPTGTRPPIDVNNLYRVVAPVGVQFAGNTIMPQFAGLTPGFVGLYQVNFQVPAGTASGNKSLVLLAGSKQTAPIIVPVQ